MNSNDVNLPNDEFGGVIPKSGLVKFLESRAGIPKEVALKVFPPLARLMSEGAQAISSVFSKALDGNTESQRVAMEHENFVASVYAEQLRIENLSSEERTLLIEKLEASVKRSMEKDSENKLFISKLLTSASSGIITALALAVVLVSLASKEKSS